MNENIEEMKEVISKLKEEYMKEDKNNDEILKYERIIHNKIESISKIADFYSLPLELIYSVLSNINFYAIENSAPILKNIVQQILKVHNSEKEKLFLLECIKLSKNDDNFISSYTLEDCVNILQCFSHCDLLVELGKSFQISKEYDQYPEIDADYELSKKDQQIDTLVQAIRDSKYDVHKAAKEGNLPIIQYLIDQKPSDVDSRDPFGRTALHIASAEGHLDIVKYLIEKANADKNAVDQEQNTSLHSACYTGKIDIVKYLIEEAHLNREAVNYYLNTPFLQACRSSSIFVVKYLYEVAHVNRFAVDRDGANCLLLACKSGSVILVRYLIEKVGIDIKSQDATGKFPLHYACIGNKIDVVKYLVENKLGDPNIKDRNNETCIDIASNKLYRNIVDYFKSKGFQSNKNKNYWFYTIPSN